ncbi:MAG TPA: carbohydrate ABC transporter permease [Candidatus Hydrogenedentes bacterium]|nr:carbohydrate ABC transporter permease [Candidatus Hydrogenedentota bacterium]HPG68596.1 carbohydrate ABC transporter permease [Candidatus Hydrogenedentota bacterium]
MKRDFVLTHLAVLALSAVFLFPFIWLLTSALKPNELLKQWPPIWVFSPTLEHIRELFAPASPFRFWQFLSNTLFVCAFTVTGNILASSMVAYGFARLRWPGRNLLFYTMLGTMMVPAQTMMIPVFLVFRRLGWIDSFLPLIVPPLFGNAFFIFMLRQFFLTVPRDLLDAARVDGHGEIAIWWRVVMPLSIPAIAVVGLFSFLGSWNDFINPLIYLLDETRYTLSLGLAMFQGQYEAQYGRLMAASALMTCPIVVLFFFTQRQFIEGIKMTGIKG